jgi:hypothetical protein
MTAEQEQEQPQAPKTKASPTGRDSRRTPLKKLHEQFTRMFNRDDVQDTYRKTAKHRKAALLAGQFFTEHGEPISLSRVYRVMREAAGKQQGEEEEKEEGQVCA